MEPQDTPMNGRVDFTPEELQSLRQVLLEKRKVLTATQATQLDALHSAGKHHLADLEEMGDTIDTESFCEIMDIGASTIEQIDRALERIDEGTYGVCEHCELPIRRARLKYLPFANLCVDCQRRKEQSVKPQTSWSAHEEEWQ